MYLAAITLSVGLQLLAAIGVHRDVAGAQYGAAVVPLIKLGLHRRRFALHVEGIPVVSMPQRASAFYGRAAPAVGIAQGALGWEVDRRRRLWVGLGATVINQRTPLPNISQVVSSRLAGFRAEVRYRRSLRSHRFFEATLGAAPRLWGEDHFLYSNGTPAVNKPETASEVDASAAVGIKRAHSEFLIGVRMLNFAARFANTGEAADRNSGVGVMVEWQRLFGS